MRKDFILWITVTRWWLNH